MTRGNQRDQDRIKNQKKAQKKVNDTFYTQLSPPIVSISTVRFSLTPHFAPSRKQPTLCLGRNTSKKRSRMLRSCEGSKQMVSIFQFVPRCRTICRQYHAICLSLANSRCLKLANASKVGSDKKKWPALAWIHRTYLPPHLRFNERPPVVYPSSNVHFCFLDHNHVCRSACVWRHAICWEMWREWWIYAGYLILYTGFYTGKLGLLAHFIIALYLARRYSNAEEFLFFVRRAMYHEGTRDYINHTCCLKDKGFRHLMVSVARMWVACVFFETYNSFLTT